MQKMMLAVLLAMLASAVAGASPAGAQINPFGRTTDGPHLTNDDWQMVWQSSDALNRASSLQPGSDRSWSNPRSGNSGTVTIDRIFTSDNMPCHALRYSVSMAAQNEPQDYKVTWCQTAAGEWKMLQ